MSLDIKRNEFSPRPFTAQASESTDESDVGSCRKTIDTVGRRLSPAERTKAAVYATGNRWAIENFNATH